VKRWKVNVRKTITITNIVEPEMEHYIFNNVQEVANWGFPDLSLYTEESINKSFFVFVNGLKNNYNNVSSRSALVKQTWSYFDNKINLYGLSKVEIIYQNRLQLI
jgi:hypothetical protein